MVEAEEIGSKKILKIEALMLETKIQMLSAEPDSAD